MRLPLVLALVLATTAFAAPKPKVIVDASGPMKALLTKALKKKFTPVPPKSDIPDEPGAGAVKQAVREAGAVAIVTARLGGGVWSVMALNGADGAPLEQFKFKAPPGKKPLKALPKGTDKRLESALSKARAPARDDGKKDEPKEDPKREKDEPVAEVTPKKTGKAVKEDPKEDPKEEDAPVKEVEKEEEPARASSSDAADKPVALNIGAGVKLFGRRFFYRDDIFESLSKYTLPVGPALQLEADWYPGAHFTDGPGAHVGISVGFNYALGISSVANDGTRYGTSAVRLRLGLIGRLTFGRIQLLPQFGYVLQNYNIANGANGDAKPNIPDVRYSILRAGLGTRINLFGPLSLTAGAAYEAPLSTGEISSASYFPRLKAGGLDANFGFAVGPIFDRIELRLGVEYIRFWYTLNPEPGDTSVAGGALDDSFGGSLMLAFTL
jgi:hypothetical protein